MKVEHEKSRGQKVHVRVSLTTLLRKRVYARVGDSSIGATGPAGKVAQAGGVLQSGRSPRAGASDDNVCRNHRRHFAFFVYRFLSSSIISSSLHSQPNRYQALKKNTSPTIHSVGSPKFRFWSGAPNATIISSVNFVGIPVSRFYHVSVTWSAAKTQVGMLSST